MKKRKLLLILSLLLPLFSFIDVNAQEGWVEENNETYYYKNEQKLEGFQEIDGKNYFFGIGSNRLLHGWQYYEGKFYADPESGEIKPGWQHIGTEDYYIRENHTVEGFQEIDGKNYFFGIGSNRLLHGWQYYEGKFYADPESGEIKQGWQHIGTEDYYIRDNHTVEGFQEIDGKNYFFGIGSNRLLRGWQYYEGKFYADPENGEIKPGWQHIGTEDYYIRDNHTVEGIQEIDGKNYFFGIGSNRLLHGWQSWNGDYYYGGSDGAFITGIQTINNRQYKFNDDTGLLEGFKVIDGKTYYYNPDGTQARGIQYMIDQFWKFNNDTGEFEKIVRQIRVIDISHNNGNIDWNKVKQSGLVDAVILRIGFGIGYRDRTFEYNKNELERLGIPYSIYLFSYAENADEALKESNWLIELSNEYKVNIATNIFSIYYDLEDWDIKSTGESSNNISKETYGQMINTFVENTEKTMCIKTKVYASTSFIANRFPDSAKNNVGWVADWRGYIGYDGAYEGWQYTSEGQIPGISGNVDMNLFYY